MTHGADPVGPLRSERRSRWAVAFVVGLVLSDAAVVMLALPAIYRDFQAEVAEVAWVVTAFNLALAVAAIPAATLVPRIGAARLCAIGLVGFAAASTVCALAPNLGVLIAGRAALGLAGAAAICAALELLPAVTGGEGQAARAWAAAGIAGAAIGPAAGGVLTQLFSWQAIFVVQVPLALAPLLYLGANERHKRPPAGRPHVAANVALVLLSAGLTVALFLIVLLLIEGWRLSPIAAAAIVTALPVASILTGPVEHRLGTARTRAIAGTLIGAGGLAALGLLPDASWWWTLPPQVLVGAGLALSLGGLTEAAMAGRSRQALHGGVTIASRHAGIVLGLLVLTPVFVADLEHEREQVERVGVATVIDSQIEPGTKLRLATALADELDRAKGRLPDVRASFTAVNVTPEEQPLIEALADRLDGELDEAASQAFSRSFLFAAVFALLGLLPLALARQVRL